MTFWGSKFGVEKVNISKNIDFAGGKKYFSTGFNPFGNFWKNNLNFQKIMMKLG